MKTPTRLERLSAVRQMCESGEAARLRTARRLSQEEIAAEIGVSRAAVAAWESGRRRPRGEAALRYLSSLRRLEALA